MNRAPWNRCDGCGKFIAMAEFGNGAVRDMVYPDSDRTRETWATLCKECNSPVDPPVRVAGDDAGGDAPHPPQRRQDHG